MRRGLRSGAAALAISAFIGNAWGEEACVNPPELTALQAAAVQQRFMVAALVCGDVELYNSFVTTYRQELQKSDAALAAFFLRLNAETGDAEYHAYKTRLANLYSLRSDTNKKAYCRNAEIAFESALDGKRNLADVVSAQPIAVDEPFKTCGEEVAGGGMAARLSDLVAKAPLTPTVGAAMNAAAPADAEPAPAPVPLMPAIIPQAPSMTTTAAMPDELPMPPPDVAPTNNRVAASRASDRMAMMDDEDSRGAAAERSRYQRSSDRYDTRVTPYRTYRRYDPYYDYYYYPQGVARWGNDYPPYYRDQWRR